MFNFSVIVCVYNCSESDLIFTLESIVKQKFMNFEIIIADDGSNVDYSELIKNFMMKNSFENYNYIRNLINKGTVRNLLSAITLCNGKYVKPIGTGDLLFDEDVLSNLHLFMENNNCKIAFGERPAYIIDNAEKIKKIQIKNPLIVSCYKKHETIKIIRNLVTYSDHISGASLVYETKIFKKYLERICDKIKYIEDYIPLIAALDRIDIMYFNKPIVYYQMGTGISTKKNKENSERLNRDKQQFNALLNENYFNDKFVQRRNKINNVECKKYKVFSIMKKIIIEPNLIVIMIKKYINNRCFKSNQVIEYKEGFIK